MHFIKLHGNIFCIKLHICRRTCSLPNLLEGGFSQYGATQYSTVICSYPTIHFYIVESLSRVKICYKYCDRHPILNVYCITSIWIEVRLQGRAEPQKSAVISWRDNLCVRLMKKWRTEHCVHLKQISYTKRAQKIPDENIIISLMTGP